MIEKILCYLCGGRRTNGDFRFCHKRSQKARDGCRLPTSGAIGRVICSKLGNNFQKCKENKRNSSEFSLRIVANRVRSRLTRLFSSNKKSVLAVQHFQNSVLQVIEVQ